MRAGGEPAADCHPAGLPLPPLCDAPYQSICEPNHLRAENEKEAHRGLWLRQILSRAMRDRREAAGLFLGCAICVCVCV